MTHGRQIATSRLQSDGGGREPTISVIVPTYNRPQSLARCLGALNAQTLSQDSFEVVVCDDGSFESLTRATGSFPDDIFGANVTVLRHAHLGPAAARNLGADSARGRYLAFTDDDCEPSPDWLERLLARFRANPAAMVGGGILNGLTADPYADAMQAIMEWVFAEQERGEGPRMFSTSNLAVPASDFRSLGGFSAQFPDAAGEDYDLCWRWYESGRPAEWAPEATIMHRHPLMFTTYLRRHFDYGRGLLRVRRRRVERTSTPSGRGPGFYLRLVTHPLDRWSDPTAWRRAALIGWSQLATALGAAVELIRPARGPQVEWVPSRVTRKE